MKSDPNDGACENACSLPATQIHPDQMADRRNRLRSSESERALITSSAVNQARRAWSMPKRQHIEIANRIASPPIAAGDHDAPAIAEKAD